MKKILNKSVNIIKNFSKEIIIALIFALVAYITVEEVKDLIKEKRINNIKKATAVVLTYDKGGKLLSQGSGIFIKPDGLLVTNYHVIEGAGLNSIEAKLSSGSYYKFKDILGVDKKSDVAIIQFDAKENPFVKKLGDSDKIQSGDEIIIIGAPLGLENSLTKGVVSNPRRKIFGQEFIQFDASISSGSSGGGLFNKNGKAIGIVTFAIASPDSKEVLTQNINFAVPINTIKNVLKGEVKDFTEGSPEYFYSKGIIAKNEKKYNKAIEYFKKAIYLDKNYVDAYIDLGIIYYEKGLYDDELNAFNKAIQLDPNCSDSYYYLATAYEDKGQYDKAIKAYKRVLEIKPNDKDAIYQLGILYIVQGEKNEAKKLIPRLIELNPGLGNQLKMLLNKTK